MIHGSPWLTDEFQHFCRFKHLKTTDKNINDQEHQPWIPPASDSPTEAGGGTPVTASHIQEWGLKCGPAQESKTATAKRNATHVPTVQRFFFPRSLNSNSLGRHNFQSTPAVSPSSPSSPGEASGGELGEAAAEASESDSSVASYRQGSSVHMEDTLEKKTWLEVS